MFPQIRAHIILCFGIESSDRGSDCRDQRAGINALGLRNSVIKMDFPRNLRASMIEDGVFYLALRDGDVQPGKSHGIRRDYGAS